jgi:hypothetical protein
LALIGSPTIGSDVVFPPVFTLPNGSPTAINFNFSGFDLPINSLVIQDSYTFQGNSITINDDLVASNPPGGLTNATILLSGLTLTVGASIVTDTGSTLNLANAASPTGLQLGILGGLSKFGGGQLVIDTQKVLYPSAFGLRPFAIAGGTVTIGTSTSLSGSLFQIGSGSSLAVADGASAKIGSMTGSGLVNLEGTTAPTDQTSLTVMVPASESDQFSGPIQGIGQFIMTGNGTLTTGPIDFSDAGSVQVRLGTLDVNGAISAGTLQVGTTATLGGLGPWHFSGAAVFQAGSRFVVTLEGLTAGTQYTQLVDSDSTTGIDLGNSILSGSVGYEYEKGDQFTIASAPRIVNQYQNVVGGVVLLGNNVPFAVTYANTAVTLTALQSETTTRLSSSTNVSHPGQPVTFTATVGTRTAPVTTGTVSFLQGTTILATVALDGSGTASFTTTALPLGSTTITAVYSGTTDVLSSTSTALTQSVVPYTTETSLASSANPILPGQPVTLTAIVRTKETGLPVTAGTVTFVRRHRLLGTVPLGSDGTAQLTVSSLKVGKGRIQAIYNGTPEDLPSVSPTVTQSVVRFPTATRLAWVGRIRHKTRGRILLKATVVTTGTTGVTPVGSVVFRRHGRPFRIVPLTNGTAVLVLHRRIPRRATVVAAFQGSSQFQPSKSAPVHLSG